MKNKVCVLLSIYNGEKFLEKQLSSLFSQTYKNFDLLIRDDGSNDNSLKILEKNRLKYIKGRNVGVIKSFLLLLDYALNYDYEYFFFCDQDDIWNDNKIEKQLNLMELNPQTYPILIHSDMSVIDENDNIISKSFFKLSRLDYNKKTLNYLLLQNNITGNSIIINRKLANLVKYHEYIIMHDWWLALIASAFGKIFFINEPLLKYRKHSNNFIGVQKFFSLDKLKKINKYTLESRFLQAYAFKELYFNKLNIDNKNIVNNFLDLQRQSGINKRLSVLKYKFFAQDLIRNLGLLWKI